MTDPSSRRDGAADSQLPPRRRETERTTEELVRLAFEEEERAIVHHLWEIARNDPPMSASLLRALLSAAAEAGGKPGARATAALEALPVADGTLKFKWARNFHRELSLTRQMYEDLFKGGCRESAQMDWAWEGESVAIGVKIHITSPLRLPKRRLHNCVDALRATGKRTRCALLLSTEPPRRRQVPRASTPEWLGALTWSEVETRLREIAPLSQDAELWCRTLEEALALGELRATI